MLRLCSTHSRPILEYCSSVWNIGYIDDLRLLEAIQSRWTKKINGMENFAHLEHLEGPHLTFCVGLAVLACD